MWERYITGDPDDPEGDLMAYARSYSHDMPVCGVLSSSDDWVSIMDELEINGRLKRAIIMPEFRDLRGTGSCKFWVLEAMDVAFAALWVVGGWLVGWEDSF